MLRSSLLLSLAGLAAIPLFVGPGCADAARPLISELRASSVTVAPSGSGDSRPIAVTYVLSRPATIHAFLLSGPGERYYLRREEPRPVPGQHSLSFDGSYAADLEKGERRVVPDGSYQLVVEARDESGRQERSSTSVVVRDADTEPPAIQGLTLHPAAISPNSDGVDDTLVVSYRTTEPATTSLYLLSDSGKRYLLAREEGRRAGERSASWDGQVGSRLLPAGDYEVLVEARDAAGNVAVASEHLRVDSAAVPDARLLAVSFEPRRLLPGGIVRVEMRVKNTGTTALRSQGPAPGYSYSTRESFSTIDGGIHLGSRGGWRVGVDWSSVPDVLGSRYPFRWGFGKDLLPGEEVDVIGYIRVEHQEPRIWLHAGLIQEQVRYWDDGTGRTAIEIGY